MRLADDVEQFQVSKDSFSEKVYCVVRDVFKLGDGYPLSIDMGFYDIDGWDSLGMLQLLNEVQRVFDIEIELEEGANVKKISDILSIVEKHAK